MYIYIWDAFVRSKVMLSPLLNSVLYLFTFFCAQRNAYLLTPAPLDRLLSSYSRIFLFHAHAMQILNLTEMVSPHIEAKLLRNTYSARCHVSIAHITSLLTLASLCYSVACQEAGFLSPSVAHQLWYISPAANSTLEVQWAGL